MIKSNDCNHWTSHFLMENPLKEEDFDMENLFYFKDISENINKMDLEALFEWYPFAVENAVEEEIYPGLPL